MLNIIVCDVCLVNGYNKIISYISRKETSQ